MQRRLSKLFNLEDNKETDIFIISKKMLKKKTKNWKTGKEKEEDEENEGEEGGGGRG